MTAQNNLPFGINIENDYDTKIHEDKYEVYVNGQFVGHKTLKNPGEKLSDIHDFLQKEGITDFSATLEGDHYHIKTNDQNTTDILSVYFNNR